MYGLNSRMNMTEERINEFADTMAENTHFKLQ